MDKGKLIAGVVLASILGLSSVSGADERGDQMKQGPVYREVSTADELYKALSDALPGGGTIKLKPGIYTISKTLEIKDTSSIYIEGSGWNTVIKKTGDGDAILLENAGFCTIRDLLIIADDSVKNGSGISCKGTTSSCTVDFCRICEFPTNGVRYEGDPKRPMSSNTVRDCHFIGNKEAGLYSYNNNDFYIVRNQFGTHDEHPEVGCVLDHSSAGTYTMNYHWGNVIAFKMGPGASYNRVENNRFEESDRIAVVIGDPEKPGDWSMFNIFTGNTFHTNSKEKLGEYSAMEAYDCRVTTFTSNQFLSWDTATHKHKHSLVIGRNCDKWIVKDNFFLHNTKDDIVYDQNMEIILNDNITD